MPERTLRAILKQADIEPEVLLQEEVTAGRSSMSAFDKATTYAWVFTSSRYMPGRFDCQNCGLSTSHPRAFI
jgi:hypothetical protein